jgi:hypothetical protein
MGRTSSGRRLIAQANELAGISPAGSLAQKGPVYLRIWLGHAKRGETKRGEDTHRLTRGCATRG